MTKARLVAVALLLAAARSARADGYVLQLEPGYSLSRTSVTAPGAGTTVTDATAVLQRYRLTLDKTLYPLVRVGGGFVYDWTLGWSDQGGPTTEQDVRRWNGNLRLDVGDPFLRGGVAYARGQDSSSTKISGLTTRGPTIVRDSIDGYLGWKPPDWPALDLRVGRARSYDDVRVLDDTTADTAQLTAAYNPIPALQLGYFLRWSDTEQRLRATETTALSQSLRETYSDTFLENRLTVYAQHAIVYQRVSTATGGGGANVTTQQSPSAGLSLVEDFPAVPERDVLAQNPALVDGDLAGTTGVDLGFGVTTTGDNRFRDLGARFADPVPELGLLHVWVDRVLPAEIAAAYSWSAYRSDDGETWTAVPIVAPVQFSPIQPRFEIPIAATTARFVKVVARPLSAAITSDRRFASILVTELQAFTVTPAALARGTRSTLRNEVNGSARLLLLRAPALAYDTSVNVVRLDTPAVTTFDFTNGLSIAQRLGASANASARATRSDADRGRGHEADNRLSASLAATPLEGLAAAVTASGGVGQTPTGTTQLRSILVTVTAEPYKGVSTLANASYTRQRGETGRRAAVATTLGSITLTPNPKASLTGTAAYSDTRQTGGGRLDEHDRAGRFEGTLTLTPVRAIYLSGGATRLTGARATTLANVAVSAAPFAGGDLVLTFSFQESLDTAADARARTWGPNVRWNLRSDTYLNLSYTSTETSAPALGTSAKVLFLNLLVTLG